MSEGEVALGRVQRRHVHARLDPRSKRGGVEIRGPGR